MTSTVFDRGSKWSAALLYDGWGEGVSDEQVKQLGDLVVERFSELAKEAGSTVFWQPSTGEVIGEVVGTGPEMWEEVRDDGGKTTPELMEEWRWQARDEVWGAVIGESNNAEIMAEVTAILGMGYCSGCGRVFNPGVEGWKETPDGDLCPECAAQWEGDAEAEIRLQTMD